MGFRRRSLLVSLGILVMVLIAGMGLFIVFQIHLDTPNEDSEHIEAYPFGPEKPNPLNSSSVVDYTVTYEERLFYNDLLAKHGYSFDTNERVITNCTNISFSNTDTDEFRVRLECRGGVTDASQLPKSEEFTYSATYLVTDNVTKQTELQNYPFSSDREFANGRN